MRLTIFILCLLTSVAQVVSAAEAKSASGRDKLCKATYTDPGDGRTGNYAGECVNGIPSGIGTVTFFNGDVLEGEFKDGLLNGNGTLYAGNGNVYKGRWQDGKRHGLGKFTWGTGSVYEGEWTDDMRHGQGTFVWANGNRFEGEFRQNKHYNGKYYTSSGRIAQCRLGQCR